MEGLVQQIDQLQGTLVQLKRALLNSLTGDNSEEGLPTPCASAVPFASADRATFQAALAHTTALAHHLYARHFPGTLRPFSPSNKKEGEALKKENESPPRESIASIARRFQIPVELLRLHNPHLADLSDAVALPVNCFLVLPSQAIPPHTSPLPSTRDSESSPFPSSSSSEISWRLPEDSAEGGERRFADPSTIVGGGASPTPPPCAPLPLLAGSISRPPRGLFRAPADGTSEKEFREPAGAGGPSPSPRRGAPAEEEVEREEKEKREGRSLANDARRGVREASDSLAVSTPTSYAGRAAGEEGEEGRTATSAIGSISPPTYPLEGEEEYKAEKVKEAFPANDRRAAAFDQEAIDLFGETSSSDDGGFPSPHEDGEGEAQTSEEEENEGEEEEEELFNGIPRTLTGYYTAAPVPRIHAQLRRQLSPPRERLLTRLPPPPALRTLTRNENKKGGVSEKGKEGEREGASLAANENERRHDIPAGGDEGGRTGSGRGTVGNRLSGVRERTGAFQHENTLLDVSFNQPVPALGVSGRVGLHGKGFFSSSLHKNHPSSPPTSLESGERTEIVVKEAEKENLSLHREQDVEPAEDADYDTIERIARSYGITVGEVLSWNPSLAGYGLDEPLPANLPIVLLVPDDEGEEPRQSISPVPMKP